MGKIFSSHSSGRSYTAKRHDIHGQSGLRQLEEQRRKSTHHAQVLEHAPTPRFQGRHSIRHAEASDSSKKAVAIFFTLLLAYNELFPLIEARPLKGAQGSQKAEKNQKTTHKKPSHTLHQVVDFGTRALGNLAFGPLGVLLTAPGSAAALETRSFAERAERAHEAWNEAQHATTGEPLLYGKLDAAAEGFEKAAVAFTQFHKEHPVLADITSSAAMMTAKGLTCAAQAAPAGAALGAIVGAALGPGGSLVGAAEGALYMAGRGFLVCAQAAIAQDALGRGVHAIAGDQLDHFLGGVIDTMTPLFEKIDPRLQETGRGRIFSTGVLSGISSAADVTLGTGGLLQYVHRGPLRMVDVSDAFVRVGLLTVTEVSEVATTSLEHGLPATLQEIAFRRAINFGSQAMANPGQATFSYDPIHDLGQPGNYFEQPGTKEAFRKKLAYTISQAQEKAVEYVARANRELLEKGLEVNQQLSSLLKKPEKKVSFQEMHQAIERVVGTFDYREARKIVVTFSGIASDWALLQGNPRLANKIQRYSEAGIKMWDAIGGIMNSNAAGSFVAAGASGAASGSALGPYGALIGAAVHIAAVLFSPEQSDPVLDAINQWGQAISKQLSEGFQRNHEEHVEIYKLIAEVGMGIIQRMDEWGYHIDREIRETMRAVLDARKENLETRDILEFRMDTFEQEIQVLRNLVESNLKEIMSTDLRKLRNMFLDVSEKLRSFTDMPVDIRAYAEIADAALRRNDPPSSSFNGYLVNTFSPAIRNQVLTSNPNNAIGYVLHYLESLGIALPDGLHAHEMHNPAMLRDLLLAYRTLRTAMQEKDIAYDTQCKLLDKIIEKCELELKIPEFLKREEIWNTVFTEYLAAYENLKSLEARAFERASQELSNQVGFTVSINQSLSEILALADQQEKRPADDVTEASPVVGWSENCSKYASTVARTISGLHLSQSAAEPAINKAIYAEGYLAQKLHFGTIKIHFEYDRFGYDMGGLIQFKKNDNTLLFLTRFQFTNPSMPALDYLNSLSPPGHFLGLNDEQQARAIQTAWKNGQVDVSEFELGRYYRDGDPQNLDSLTELGSLIKNDLIRRRKETASSLIASPDWRLGKERLQASVNMVRILALYGGLNEKQAQDVVNCLFKSEDIDSYSRYYIETSATRGGHVLRYQNHAFSMSDQEYLKRVRIQIVSKMRDEKNGNPLFAPIQQQLDQVRIFRKQYKAPQEKPTTPPASESSSQELSSLRREVTDLRSQNKEILARNAEILSKMEQMTKLMEKMLISQTGGGGETSSSHTKKAEVELLQQRILQQAPSSNEEEDVITIEEIPNPEL